MSGASSRTAEWCSLLEQAAPPITRFVRVDDPRLGEIIEVWLGDLAALTPGRAVLIGFPQDEGVRRNHGRVGAAQAPREIRQHLHRLTPWDGTTGTNLADRPPLDLGDLRVSPDLEESQAHLGTVIGHILGAGAVPIVLGGGHEAAYGHYLGYVAARRPVAILNVDAHLDLRPLQDGKGHSGSPFRQALEHPTTPLPGARYSCLGAQPYSVSRAHWQYLTERGGAARWCDDVRDDPSKHFQRELHRLATSECHVYVTLDADAVRAADVPGVSAPNPSGLPGEQVIHCARIAGRASTVSSFEIVEINPALDPEGRSSRWAAACLWHFLMGLAARGSA